MSDKDTVLPENKHSPMLDLALGWWQQGWNVLPVKEDKKPLKGFKWGQWKARRQTEEEVKAINWSLLEIVGVAGITGVVAEGAVNYAVLDRDKAGLKKSEKFISELPETRKHSTLHDNFHDLYISGKPCSSFDKFKSQFGFELQGIGNYIILPGSFDGRYKIVDESVDITKINDFETLIYERAKELKWKSPEEDFKGVIPSDLPQKELKCEQFFKENPLPPGSRHNVLGKNFAIHVFSLKSEDLQKVAVLRLTAGQTDFSEEDITSWGSWVKEKERNFNCFEVRKYLQECCKDFSCEDCIVLGGGKFKEDAMNVLKTQDPLEYIADTVEKLHYQDRNLSKVVWLAAISPGLGYELFIFSVGKSGTGKSDLIFVVLLTIPNEYVIAPTEISPKAIFYYVMTKKRGLDKCVIYFDDVKLFDLELLKQLASDNRKNPELWTVDIERKFQQTLLEGDWTVFASAVEALPDAQQQLLRRYIFINPNESEEVNTKVVGKIKEDMRSGKTRKQIPEEFKVAQQISRIIKELPYKVIIPFDFEFPVKGTGSRTEIKQFSTLIWAVAKTRAFQRLIIDNSVLAQPEDFVSAVELWGELQPFKLDKTALRVFEMLPDNQPATVAGKASADSMTKSMISQQLKIGASTAQQKLNLLYDLDMVDREQIIGRGSPFAYWKTESVSQTFQTQSQNVRYESPIRLKEPREEAESLFLSICPQGDNIFVEYLLRVDKFLKNISLHEELESK